MCFQCEVSGAKNEFSSSNVCTLYRHTHKLALNLKVGLGVIAKEDLFFDTNPMSPWEAQEPHTRGENLWINPSLFSFYLFLNL